MAVLRITRFKTDPADADEMITRRSDLIAAIRDVFPGLSRAQLARVDDETWVDVWHWDSMAGVRRALEGVANVPQAAAAFALIKDSTAESAEIIDDR